MLFKLDENLPNEIVSDLEASGHQAETVYTENLAGAPDEIVVEAARREGRVLLTLDKGIANITSYPTLSIAGIVLFRPPSSGRGQVLAFVRKNLPEVLGIDLRGRLLVISNRGIRLR